MAHSVRSGATERDEVRAPAAHGSTRKAEAGEARAGSGEGMESLESSGAPDTPAQTRHVSDRDGPAASNGARAKEAVAQAVAQGAAGWSTLSRMVAVGGDAKVELGGWAADGTEWEDAAAAAAVVVVRN